VGETAQKTLKSNQKSRRIVYWQHGRSPENAVTREWGLEMRENLNAQKKSAVAKENRTTEGLGHQISWILS
jgi:hypothetical protein